MQHSSNSAVQELERKAAELKASLEKMVPIVSTLAKELSGFGRFLKKVEASATELLSVAQKAQQEAAATEKERLLNLIRKPKSELSPLEKGQKCLELSENFGCSDKEIAYETNYDIKQIRNFKSMLETFTPSIRNLIANERVAYSVAFEEMRAFPHTGERYLLKAWEIARMKGKKSLTEADLNEIGGRPQRN